MADLVYSMNNDNDENPCLHANKMPPRSKKSLSFRGDDKEKRIIGIGAGDGLIGALKAACLRQMSFLFFSFLLFLVRGKVKAEITKGFVSLEEEGGGVAAAAAAAVLLVLLVGCDC